MDAAQCVATSKQSGKRCRRAPIPGGSVCKIHGGGAPQVKAAAAKRLDELRPLALRRLEWLLEQEDYPSTMYQAVRDVLDRNDGRPAETVRMELDTVDAQLRRLDEGRARVAAAKRLRTG